MPRIIILVSGRATSGKDSFCNNLRKFMPSLIQFAFAERLRLFCHKLFGFMYGDTGFPRLEYSQWSDQATKERPLIQLMEEATPFASGTSATPMDRWRYAGAGMPPLDMTPRDVLRFVGTELCRNMLDENVWVNSIIKQIKETGPDAVVVVTDCRFPNEVTMLREVFGKTDKVIHVLITEPEADAKPITSPTENVAALPKSDIVIANDKTKGIDYLETKIVESGIVEMICAGTGAGAGTGTGNI